MEGLTWLGNASLILVFANTVFHERAMLQIFYAEYTESVIEILSYPKSTMGPPWLSQEKNFQNVDSQKPGKQYFTIGIIPDLNSSKTT